jgi:hypothetical protein
MTRSESCCCARPRKLSAPRRWRSGSTRQVRRRLNKKADRNSGWDTKELSIRAANQSSRNSSSDRHRCGCFAVEERRRSRRIDLGHRARNRMAPPRPVFKNPRSELKAGRGNYLPRANSSNAAALLCLHKIGISERWVDGARSLEGHVQFAQIACCPHLIELSNRFRRPRSPAGVWTPGWQTTPKPRRRRLP